MTLMSETGLHYLYHACNAIYIELLCFDVFANYKNVVNCPYQSLDDGLLQGKSRATFHCWNQSVRDIGPYSNLTLYCW